MLIEEAVAEVITSVFVEPSSISMKEEPNIWLGLSGGVDSTVLLHAAAHYCSANPVSKLKAIHVHHGLSVNADAWAEQAQSLCKKLSQECAVTIDCVIEKVQLDDRSDGLEQAARSARYQAFSKYCGPNDILLQGHHLDDQIETFFMRAIRGSGLTGLASIPKQRSLSRDNTCQILRPLLTIEKNQLLEYAKKHQLNWVEDESNQDSKIERNWWRNELLPQIWQYYPKQKQALSRTISNIQHEQDLLQKLLQDSLQSPLKGSISEIHSALQDIPSFNLLLIQGLDQATSVSYLRAWFAQYVDILPSAIQMKTIYVDMVHARIDSDPSISWSASRLYRYQHHLYLLDTAVLNLLDNSFDESQLHDWQGENFSCYWGLLTCNELATDYGLKPAQYCIRNWQAGDVAKPIGRATRKMKKWWQDYNVPSWVREQWPIIVNKETNEIAAVPGLFVCQGYRVEEGQVGWVVDYNVTIR
jgi:tRNA(Ile)-lysidine synthase